MLSQKLGYPACMHTLPRVHGEEGARLSLGFAQDLNPRLFCRHTLTRVAMRSQGNSSFLDNKLVAAIFDRCFFSEKFGYVILNP